MEGNRVMTPKVRQSLYAVGTIATSVLTLLSLWGIVNPVAASSVSSALVTLLGLFGVGAAGTAAVVTGKQRRDGTLEHLNPAEQVAQGLKAAQEQIAAAKAQSEAVRSAVTNMVDDVPVLGPLAADVLDKIRF